LQALLADRANREQLEALESAPSDFVSPSELLERRREDESLLGLPLALEQLPPQERQAVTLYFGLGDAEHNLAEVGSKLGLSEYLARMAVVRALTMLSAFLGIQGGLQSDEFELLQHLFVEGMDLANAAARMKLSDRRARQMVARVGQKFREGRSPC
jgi:hypothetical protein